MSNESDPGHLLPEPDWARIVQEVEAMKAAEAAAQKAESE